MFLLRTWRALHHILLLMCRWISKFHAYLGALLNQETPSPWPGRVDNGDIVDTSLSGETVSDADATLESGSPDWRHDVKAEM